jgi:heme/copper-type cytochrome/quinol oxidase subunit 1
MPPADSDPCATVFSAACGDDPAFLRHVFWLLGHPERQSGLLLGLSLAGVTIIVRFMRNADRLFPLPIPLLWVVGFVFLAAVGGVTGLLLANAGAGLVLHDTFYIVAPVHYPISVCVWFAIFAGWYHWFPRLSGRAYSELWGRLHFWATFTGASLLVLSQSFLALGGMPRRYADLRDALVAWNYVASAGSYITAAGTLFLIVSIINGRFAARGGTPPGH